MYNYYFCVFSGRPGDHVQQHVQHDQQSTDSRGLPQVHIRCRPGPGPGHTFWGRAEVCPDHWFWWVKHMVKWRTVCRDIPTIHQTFNELIFLYWCQGVWPTCMPINCWYLCKIAIISLNRILINLLNKGHFVSFVTIKVKLCSVIKSLTF